MCIFLMNTIFPRAMILKIFILNRIILRSVTQKHEKTQMYDILNISVLYYCNVCVFRRLLSMSSKSSGKDKFLYSL